MTLDYDSDPVVHSHVSDCLPEDHPLAWEMVYCDAKVKHNCNGMLHAANNECMTTWIEFAGYNVCWRAFNLYMKNNNDVVDVDDFVKFMEAEK